MDPDRSVEAVRRAAARTREAARANLRDVFATAGPCSASALLSPSLPRLSEQAPAVVRCLLPCRGSVYGREKERGRGSECERASAGEAE